MGNDLLLKTSHLKFKSLLLVPFFAACLLGSLADQASAQASYGASRRQSHISIFGEGSRLSPDYGNNTNYGYTLGADLTQHFHLLDAAVEFRISHAGGSSVGETTYMGGLKGSKAYGRLHPYGDILMGYGKISFTHPQGFYYRDDSTVYGAGGGADVDIIGNLAGKAEFQYQTWKLGSANNRMTPTMLSIGLVYHLPY